MALDTARIISKGGNQGLAGIFYGNLFAIVLGLSVGLTAPLFSSEILSVIEFAAWLPVSLIKGFAGPLLFLAVCHGFMAGHALTRGFKLLVIVCLVNSLCAVAIAITLINLLQPGEHLASLLATFSDTLSTNPSVTGPIKTINWYDALRALVPDSVVAPFLANNIPAILVLAILFGLGVRSAGRSQDGWEPWFLSLRDVVERALGVITRILFFILKLMPFAIFASVAKATNAHGLTVFKGLFWYVFLPILGMVLHIMIVYQSWIVFKAKRSLSVFWKHARLPVVFSFGVNSSLSALPSTLQALDDLSCSKEASRLGACVGTNFNNDGILLYEVVAVLMLAQGLKLDWSLSYQLIIAGMCVLATLGVSGFPEAGIVALSLVLPAAGLPLTFVPLLLPVDWLVARCRSATNVVSDMTVSLAIDGSQ